jgi:hypothetical protein
MQPNHDPNTTSFNFGHVKSTRLHVHVSDNTLLPFFSENCDEKEKQTKKNNSR